MSVVEADEQDRGTVLYYAPRHVRYPSEERSIRPILERLSRGESSAPADAQAEMPVHAPFPLDPPQRTIGRQMIACSALSAGLSAGLAVLAIGWLAPLKPEPAQIESAQLEPKVVRTVSFQPASAQVSSVADKQDVQPETAPPPAPAATARPDKPAQRDQIAPKELLAMWSGVPSEPQADAAVAPPSVTLDGQEPQDAQAEPAGTARGERVEAARPRRAHARRHGHRRAHAAQRAMPRTASAAVEAQTTGSNPLQSALQSVFGRPAAGTQQQNGAPDASPQPQNY